jgi:hypothetical protein
MFPATEKVVRLGAQLTALQQEFDRYKANAAVMPG